MPFLRCLAGKLLGGGFDELVLETGDPMALAGVTVLLPTQRACRAFRETLLELNCGQPLLLPDIRAIGDVDVAELALDSDLEPDLSLNPQNALKPLESQILLTVLIQKWGLETAADILHLGPNEAPVIPGSPAMAVRLAAELFKLIESIETEGIDIAKLAGLVPDNHSAYWDISLEFLKILSEVWPQIIAELGKKSPAAGRNEMILAEATRLGGQKDRMVIAAGSTGSIPATAELLRTIAQLPRGAVILPGLDLTLNEDIWRDVVETASHPQHGMARLIEKLELNRDDIHELAPSGWIRGQFDRTCLARMAMLPEHATATWSALAEDLSESLQSAVEGLIWIEAATPQEEALVIALMLRGVAEDPAKSAALVTPDRNLARRVQSELGRWKIEIDDSAGVPLNTTPPGLLARHAADVMISGFRPVSLLALLKHPLVRLGMPVAEVRNAARSLERHALRGPRPASGIAGLQARLEQMLQGLRENHSEYAERQKREVEISLASDLVTRLAEALEGEIWSKPEQMAVSKLVATHRAFCLALAKGETGESDLLWQGEAGRILEKFFDDLADQCPASWSIAPVDYPDLFRDLASGRPVRVQHAAHPRIHIWGLLESRLMQVDLMILGGLNESNWPPGATADPWLSRPMRHDLGLPPPERRIGLSAHDFVQHFNGTELVITRAIKDNGAPSVASRWLLRLEAVLAAAHPNGNNDAKLRAQKWLRWARSIDNPGEWTPVSAPQPRPPVAARPRRLSVSQIETHIRDPYAIYARHILKLRPIEDLDAQLDAAIRGTWIHEVLARFSADAREPDQEKSLARLHGISAELLVSLPGSREAKAIWERRFARAAAWFVGIQQDLLSMTNQSFPEIPGKIEWPSPGGDFRLTARADRIDVKDDGTLAIYDYKTGAAPSVKQVDTGLAPQLALEAAIAADGGFDTPANLKASTSRLAYLEMTGGTPPGRIVDINRRDPALLADIVLADLKTLIETFDQDSQAYHSRPHPQFEARFGDYDHLARVKEWARGEAGGGE